MVRDAAPRGVIVSPFGLEVRRTFITWRVPWSVVESFAVKGFRGRARSAGPLTVVLVDGSVRSVRVGARRHRQRDFSEVAAAARRRPNVRPRGYLGANSPLVLFVLSGIALMVACAVADIGRLEHRYLASLPSTRADKFRELESWIAAGDVFAVQLYVIVVATGYRRLRLVAASPRAAPVGRWPEQFPDDLGGTSWPPPAADGERPAVGSRLPPQALLSGRRPLDIPPVVICRDDGVFDADETMLLAISHRSAAETKIDTYTYWSARDVADFTVQVVPAPAARVDGELSIGALWLITGWATPQPVYFEATSDDADLILRGVGTAECRLIVDPSDGGRYTVIDERRQILATIEAALPGWRCQMSTELPLTTRRLLCVAALWAEQRSLASSSPN